MRVFEIVDTHVRTGKRRACAKLLYNEEERDYRIEIEPWATENDVPMLLIPFIHTKERALDGTWSRRWVEERIVPPSRQNIGQVLKANNLDEYDDFKLLLASMGRCSQDDFGLVEVTPDSDADSADPTSSSTPTLAESMGAELARARREARLTQIELATRSGVQQAAISRIERGVGNPTLALVEALANCLGVRLKVTGEKLS